MLRHRSRRPRSSARCVALVAIVACLAGCGIKGPLVAPPAPGAGAPAGTAAPATPDRRNEPKL